jgi:hypothetical protein
MIRLAGPFPDPWSKNALSSARSFLAGGLSGRYARQLPKKQTQVGVLPTCVCFFVLFPSPALGEGARVGATTSTTA